MTMHHVFVYGTLKHGFCNHGLLESSAGGLMAMTVHPIYCMTGKYVPYVFKNMGFHNMLSGKIKGELYLVTEEVLRKIDYLEGHPTHYTRLKTTVLCSGEYVEAWMYQCSRPSSEPKPEKFTEAGELYYEH